MTSAIRRTPKRLKAGPEAEALVMLISTRMNLWGCSEIGGFPLVPDARLRQWAAMLERNTGVSAR
jgi:hypothetical protein